MTKEIQTNNNIEKINFPYILSLSYGKIVKSIQWRESNEPKEIKATLERCYSIVHLYARKAFSNIGISGLNPEIKPIRIKLKEDFTIDKSISISTTTYWNEIILNFSNEEQNKTNLDDLISVGGCIYYFYNTFLCPEFLKKIFPGKDDEYYTKKTTMEEFNKIYTYIIIRDIFNLMMEDGLIYDYKITREE